MIWEHVVECTVSGNGFDQKLVDRRAMIMAHLRAKDSTRLVTFDQPEKTIEEILSVTPWEMFVIPERFLE